MTFQIPQSEGILNRAREVIYLSLHLIFPGSIWSSIKHTVTGSSKDDHEKEHKEQFTAMVRELGAALRGNNHILTMTVMPHVNYQGKIEHFTPKSFSKSAS